ncbi:MAG: hypothetical protein ABW252_16430 [Polyangiales bacterium]
MSQDWLKRLLGSGPRADLTLDEALAMVREKTEALALLEQLLHDRHKEVERLAAEEREALSKLAALSEERSEMERRLEESLVATRVAEQQLLGERIAQRAAATRADELGRAVDELTRRLAARDERVAQLEKQQAQQAAALHYERRRWRGLVGVFWEALEQALGEAAALPLARVLRREREPREGGELPHAETLAEATPLLAQALRTRALGGGASVRELEGGIALRIEPPEPQLPDDAVPAWVGLVAAQLLARLLGRPIALEHSERAGAALSVRVRFRGPPEPRPSPSNGRDASPRPG